MSASIQPSARTCGPCTYCCTVLHVAELAKPRYVACGELCATGCGIYEDPGKPAICGDYRCMWLAGTFDLLRDNERPDVTGLIVEWAVRDDETGLQLLRTIGAPMLVAHECWEGAAQGYWGRKVLQRLSKRFVVAVVWEDDRRLIGPRLAVLRAAQLADASTRVMEV